ncbi:hypothetical protein [Oceanicaulis sp. MMSF_3324]|uniref:hypothetical protein n=1 Tax=Oceanicaulis sp. MMSF_3324 TaxID=3046702 RepID=UPI00273DC9DA|nr:hypothetical protein [Oceanicaulis sp. MMSF_3324]
MELATADAVQPREGEAAFILQLRPPATAHADALATELERFTSLYLERAAAEHVRFTPLGALTWALCAPVESVDEVDAACDELAQTLFGDPSSEAVHLARQPDHPRKEDFGIQNQSLSDEEGEAVMDDLAEHEWDFATGEDDRSDAEEASNDGVVDLEADDDDDTVDLDDFVPPPELQDDWELENPIESEASEMMEDAASEAEAADDAALSVQDNEAAEPEAPEGDQPTDEDPFAVSEADAFDEPIAFDPDIEDPQAEETDVANIDSFEAEAESADIETAQDPETISEPATEPDAVLTEEASDEDVSADRDEPDLEYDAEPATEPAFDAALEDDIRDTLDIEDELEDFVLEDEESRPPQTEIWDEDVDTVDIDDIAASALHETRLGSNLDVAAELNAFREEMRAIAQSIPAGGLDATLSDFRAGLESLSGELGQRVDGAAQRIEAAVGQLDVDRYDAASHRVESAASLMETSIQEALAALKQAGAAMSAPTESDMFEAQEQDSL